MYEIQISDYLRDALLENSVGRTSPPALPAEAWLSLHTESPEPDGSGAEATLGRKAAAFAAATAGQMATSDEIELQKTTGPAETITHWGLWDDETGGHLLWFGPLLARRYLGGSDTEYTVTNTGGLIWRYTWTGSGADPGISAAGPLPGDKIIIDAPALGAGNSGTFIVIDSGTNWFEVINADGEAETAALGVSGSILNHTPTTSVLNSDPIDGDKLIFAAGIIRLRLE